MEEEVLYHANTIFREANIPKSIPSIKHCNAAMFGCLYEKLTGRRAPGLIPRTDEEVQCSIIVRAVSLLLPPQVSIDHIKGEDLAKGDLLAIRNFLDIFGVLLQLPCVAVETEEQEDSNVLSEEGQKVIADVLREEKLDRFVPLNVVHMPGPITPPTRATPTPTTPVNKIFEPPRHQSTPHHGPKPRIYHGGVVLGMNKSHPHSMDGIGETPPPLSISSLSSLSTATTEDHTPIVPPTRPLSNTPHDPSHFLRDDNSSHQKNLVVPTDTGPSLSSLVDDKIFTSVHSEGANVSSNDDTQATPTLSNIDASQSVSTTSQVIPIKNQTTSTRSDVMASPRTSVHNSVLRQLVNNYVTRCNDGEVKKPAATKRKTRSSARHVHFQTLQGDCRNQGNRDSDMSEHLNHIASTLQDALPGLKISEQTERHLWHQEMKRLNAASVSHQPLSLPARKKIEEVERRHDALLALIKKEMDHSKRMKVIHQRKQADLMLKATLDIQKHSQAQAKKYFKEYETRIQARLQKKQHRVEQIYKNVFEECLKLQREKVHSMRSYSRERREAMAKKHQEELLSLENFYHDRLSMISDALSTEHKVTREMERSRKQALDQARRELRTRMESEIRQLWEGLDEWEENNAHFRQLDGTSAVARLRRGSC